MIERNREYGINIEHNGRETEGIRRNGN